MASYAAPVSGSGGTPGAYPVFPMPVFVNVFRGFQILLSIVIMGMAGYLMHGLVLGPYAFAFVCVGPPLSLIAAWPPFLAPLSPSPPL